MSDATMVGTPEAALAAADHVMGHENAKLMLLEYGDYECPGRGGAGRAEGSLKSTRLAAPPTAFRCIHH